MKNLIISIFNPGVYVVLTDKFLGDFVQYIPVYKLKNDTISFKYFEDSYIYPLSKVFLTERSAKKEAQKSALDLTFPENHVKILTELEVTLSTKGVVLSEGARQQILEEGEASEIYQKFLKEYV